MDNTIDEVSIQIESNSQGASSNLDNLANSISRLQSTLNVGLKGLSSFNSSLAKVKELTSGASFDNTGLAKIQSSLSGLNSIGKATNLSSFINQLKKIPDISQSLNDEEIGKFTTRIKELTAALSPLANEMVKVSSAFSALPSNVSKINSALGSTTKAAKTTSNTFGTGLFSGISGAVLKGGLLVGTLKRLGNTIGSFVNESNAFIENMNLFQVSMGQSTEKAQQFIDKYTEALGIDPSNVMRYMGMFNTLAEGFGIASDSAYIMSKNLTQLSYDMSSFLNIPIDQAMQKIKSGFSGEIEPMRAVGIALDQATLQETAYTLGIDKKVSAMTRAQKTELLYYQMMTRTAQMQGDMARTLITPANALRVLQQQFTLLARAIGNIFLPIISAVIPYIMLLTQALTWLANQIANLFGFVLPSIDYSSVTDGLGGISAGVGDIGSSAGKTNKELNRMLAKFDELNVIEFDKGSASGGGSGAGAGGLSGGSLGIPLPDYDALTGLASQKLEKIKKEISKFIDKIKEMWDKVSPILKKFEPLLKGLASALLTAFSINWITKFLKKFTTLKTAGTVISGIVSAVKVAIGVFSKFGGGMTGLVASATSLWRAFEKGIKSLTGFQQIVLGISSVVGIFTTVYTAIKNLTLGTGDLGTAIVNIGIAVTAFGAILSALTTGPIGIAITAITAITAGVIAYEKAQKELADQRALERLFDGQGQSMEAVLQYYEKMNNSITAYSDKIKSNSDEIDTNNEKFSESIITFDNVTAKMKSMYHTANSEDFSKLEKAFNDLGDTAKVNMQLATDSIITNAEQMRQLGYLDDETTNNIIRNAAERQETQGKEVDALKNRIKLLNREFEQGKKSPEQYYSELTELENRMKMLNGETLVATDTFDEFVSTVNSKTVKINMEDPTKATEFINKLTEVYEESREKIEANIERIKASYKLQIAEAERAGEDTAKVQEEMNKLIQANQEQLINLQGDYRGTWLTIRSEISSTGADAAKDMEEVVKIINENLKGLKDVDLSGTGEKVFNQYLEELQNGNKMAMPRVVTMLQDMGFSFKNTYLEGVQFTDAEKMIISKNWSDASQIKGSDFVALSTKISKDGITIKNSMGEAIKFTDAEKKTLSKMLSDPYNVTAADKAKILNKIIEFGGEIRDSEGNSIVFSQEEKDAIKKAMDSPILSWTESDRLIDATDKYTKNVLDTMIQNIYSKTTNANEAGKAVGNAAGDGISISIQGKSLPVAQSAQSLVSTVNTTMKNNINTTSAGDKAITDFDNAMNRGKWAITNTAGDIGSSAGNSFSKNLKVNDTSFKRSLNNVFSNTLSKLKRNNSSLFSTLGLVLPSFNWFAEGGFPETGELFVAREAGPELVGNIGNKAAVANNDQIVAGIAQAAYQGVSNALKENKGKERQQVAVYIGNKKIYSGYGQYLNSESNMYGTSTVKV